MQKDFLPANKLPRISANVTQRANIFLMDRDLRKTLPYRIFFFGKHLQLNKKKKKNYPRLLNTNKESMASAESYSANELLHKTLALSEKPAGKEIQGNFTRTHAFISAHKQRPTTYFALQTD